MLIEKNTIPVLLYFIKHVLDNPKPIVLFKVFFHAVNPMKWGS
jgi:hypothetical protein